MGFGKSRKNGKKSKKSRTTVCIIITAAIFAGFAIRLVDWQLVQGKSYKSLAAKSTGYTEKTDATRGEIVDRNGVGLVVNTTKYKIVLNKLYIEEDRLDGILLELADILTKTGDTRTDSLPVRSARITPPKPISFCRISLKICLLEWQRTPSTSLYDVIIKSTPFFTALFTDGRCISCSSRSPILVTPPQCPPNAAP